MKKRLLLFSPGLLFILLFIILSILLYNNYYIILFNKVGEFINFFCLLIGVTYTLVITIILSIKKNINYLFLLIIIVPLLFISSINTLLSVSSDYQKIKIEEFDEELLIVSDSFLLGGWSIVYERCNLLFAREICTVHGDDGAQPLNDPNYYEIECLEDRIIIHYYFNSIECEKELLYLNNRFQSN